MRKIKLQAAAAVLVMLGLSSPSGAQDRNQSTEIYHIFDFQTDASRDQLVRALAAGLGPNVSEFRTMRPVVLDAPPETARRFTLVNPFENTPMAAFVGVTGGVRQPRCDGAVWIASALRQIRGAQRLNLTMCLFPYVKGYQLDVYAVDVKEGGGSLSRLIGRAIGKAIVGDTDGWTQKTILDVVRSVRVRTGARVTYVEGQPTIEDAPWETERTLLPSNAERGEAFRRPAPEQTPGEVDR